MLRTIECWPIVHALSEWEGRVGSVSRCRRCAATAIFAGSACVCSVCKVEGGETEVLVPIIYELYLYVGLL